MTVNGINTSTPTSSSQPSPVLGGDMGTFLTLLTTELQVQDPTSPLDPDQMVGQIVSLNQLDELMQINQTLQSMSAAMGLSPTSSTSVSSNS
jgi:flagellar basal-body rod modification protein FlgD